jgi:hypothetical protein
LSYATRGCKKQAQAFPCYFSEPQADCGLQRGATVARRSKKISREWLRQMGDALGIAAKSFFLKKTK